MGFSFEVNVSSESDFLLLSLVFLFCFYFYFYISNSQTQKIFLGIWMRMWCRIYSSRMVWFLAVSLFGTSDCTILNNIKRKIFFFANFLVLKRKVKTLSVNLIHDNLTYQT